VLDGTKQDSITTIADVESTIAKRPW